MRHEAFVLLALLPLAPGLSASPEQLEASLRFEEGASEVAGFGVQPA